MLIPPGQLCDPACQKLLLDSGFTAVAAALLAKSKHVLSTSAEKLAAAARAHIDAYEIAEKRGLITRRTGQLSWEGCHRATEIMAWIGKINKGAAMTSAEQDSLAAAEAKLVQWTADEVAHLTAIVSGSTDTVKEE